MIINLEFDYLLLYLALSSKVQCFSCTFEILEQYFFWWVFIILLFFEVGDGQLLSYF